MRRVAARLGPCGHGLVLALLSNCGGQLIHLGDGTAGADATNGASAGMTNSGGNGLAGSGGGVAGQGGTGSSACLRGQVMADEVLWIGDSWIIDPGTQRSTVRDLAFAAGSIAANEEYPSSAAAAASMAKVADQYAARERGTPQVKVLLMDGGTWDPVSAQMTGGSVPDAIENSISGFELFLSQVANDGTVEHIVYFLVPELMTIPGVAEMRPRLQRACAESEVPCHFIDLQQIWQAGDPDKLTASNGIQASAEGGVAIGKAVWATMQDNCIAQ
jgi:hypothetical protein